jgi:hypothetical protein
MVIDGDVHEFPARGAQVAPIGLTDACALGVLAAVAGQRVAGHDDASELLDVDMDQLARRATLVAVGRLDRRQA